jgi:maltose O-acetyltransferase
MIGAHTAITSVTHDYRQATMYGTVVMKPVTIGSDVWIGTHCVIMPGITVGSGAVLGAGCVVTKDVPENAIVMGVPGGVVGFRPDPLNTTTSVSQVGHPASPRITTQYGVSLSR